MLKRTQKELISGPYFQGYFHRCDAVIASSSPSRMICGGSKERTGLVGGEMHPSSHSVTF